MQTAKPLPMFIASVVLCASSYLAASESISIEAESVSPVGDWKAAQLQGNTVMVFDPQTSDLDGARVSQTLSYRFTTREAATYRFALLSGRMRSRFETPAPGGDPRRFGDTRNNDVYFKLTEVPSNQVVQNTIRLYVGLRNTDSNRFWWGNMFDPSLGGAESWRGGRRAQLSLKANTEYRLDIAGRGDGFMFDRISIRSDAHLRNTEAHNAPPEGKRQTPPLPSPRIDDVDLSQYPLMENWSRAGVEGGIPTNLAIKRIIGPSD